MRKKKIKRVLRKSGQPRENPVSLAPVDFKNALAGLLATPPEKVKESDKKGKPASK